MVRRGRKRLSAKLLPEERGIRRQVQRPSLELNRFYETLRIKVDIDATDFTNFPHVEDVIRSGRGKGFTQYRRGSFEGEGGIERCGRPDKRRTGRPRRCIRGPRICRRQWCRSSRHR